MILGLILGSVDRPSLPNIAFFYTYVLTVIFTVHLVMVPGNESGAAVDIVIALPPSIPWRVQHECSNTLLECSLLQRWFFLRYWCE